jgi:hypothetical protein
LQIFDGALSSLCRPIGTHPSPSEKHCLGWRTGETVLGASEIDKTVLHVGANQLDAKFVSDVVALGALRQ